jgi:TonB family protein
LLLTIEADGTVSDVKVDLPGGYGFDEAAAAAAKKFTFKPATRDGVPTRAQIQYRYRFSLTPRGKKANPFAAPLDPGDGAPPPTALGSADLLENLPPGNVRLRLLEKGTRVPISDAQVFVLDPKTQKALKECAADVRGLCELAGLVPGPTEFKVLAPGYEPLTTRDEIPAEGALELTLRLTPVLDEGYGLVVRGEKEEEQVTRHVISAEELAKLPGSQGDVLRGIQNLPGIARAPFGGGLLVVRGSAPEDTQTFLNGMPIPLIYHFGGLTSVISNDLLAQIDFVPGVYSARYGRGNGGIIDAETRPGKNPEFHGSIDTDIFDTGVYLQGPIGDKGGSFGVAARRSYVDVLLAAVTPLIPEADGLGLTVAPQYWDYQASAGGPVLGGNGQLIAFGSSDRLALVLSDPRFGEQFFSSSTRFHRLQGAWQKEISPGLRRRVSASVGVTDVEFAAEPFFELDVHSFLAAARVDWASELSKRAALVYGLDAQVNDFNVSVLAPGENANATRETNVDVTRPDTAAYAEGRLEPVDGLLVIPGLRIDRFGGSEDVTIDPRLAVRYQLDLKTTFKGGAGVFHQDPQPQELDPTFGDPELKPEASSQVALGVERLLWKDRLSLDATVFYKFLYNRIAGNGGSGQTPADILTNDGGGRVRGLEVLLRYPPDKRFFGWIAYTLSRAERKDPGAEDFRLFGFDQTHILTALGSYKIKYDFSVGFRFRYATGLPDTPVLGGIYDADNDFYFGVDGAQNSIRLPAFHQLDVRVDKTFRFPNWTFSAYLEVMNLYNRQNPEGVFFNFDFTQQQFFNSLPILPVFGVKGEF